MRATRLGALLVLVLSLWAAPVWASPQDTAMKMVGPPDGFVVVTGPPAVNGPLTLDGLKQLAGPDAVKGIPAKAVKAALKDAYARTYINRGTRDVLVVIGYHTASDHDALAFVKGALKAPDSKDRKATLTRMPAFDKDVALFDITAGANHGRMALLRKGRYIFQILIAGPMPDADKSVPENLAAKQYLLLPKGDTALTSTVDDVATDVARIILALIPLTVIGLVIWLLVRRSRKPTPPPPPPWVEPTPEPEPVSEPAPE